MSLIVVYSQSPIMSHPVSFAHLLFRFSPLVEAEAEAEDSEEVAEEEAEDSEEVVEEEAAEAEAEDSEAEEAAEDGKFLYIACWKLQKEISRENKTISHAN